jgi:hypothetical protein
MARFIEQKGNLTVGHSGLGIHGDAPGTPGQQVHDGDTITTRPLGNAGVRFLGIDAPEISFTLPGETAFTPISNPKWETFLSAPLSADLPVGDDLRHHLQARVGAGVATNHDRHAKVAKAALLQMVIDDMAALNKTKDNFQFFLAFAGEIMDRYGRLLCFINRDQLEGERPRSYNERLLTLGVVSPYFIWPNVNPFRKQPSVTDAVIPPGTASQVANGDNALRTAREAVRNARTNGIGLFETQDPLRIQPFELRFMAQRRAPDRWVIDLGKSDNILVKPEAYFTISNIEDRLYIPKEYVPLFVEKGWQRQA